MVKYLKNNGEVYEAEYDVMIARHTCSHILAQALKRIYGNNVKLAIGPSIADGFYYDVDGISLKSEDLEKIEAEMKKIVKENLKMSVKTLSREEAINFVKEHDENYKLEMIMDKEDVNEFTFFTQGEFTDMCVGPHVLYLKSVGKFKLLNLTGAYWRGDEKNKMLTRIYGTCFEKAEELEENIKMREEAKLRDHRKLGKELELFTIMDEGPGFPFFLPKGMILKNKLIEYWRQLHREAGYVEVSTPMILNRKLWETSGHWYHYKENMYTTKIDEEDYAIKPMNCPGGMLVYKTKLRSYKDLPIRMGELGLVHRHELSGALHGLMRVRNFTQDDAHIFMTKDQIKDEIKGVVKLIDKVYSVFGFKYHIELSTQPEDSMGAKEDWDIATNALRDAVTELGYEYKINEGDGAFYGPKLDFHLTDCLGRTWQCGTIQLDFQLPERFELEYIGADGNKHRPIMLHRVIFGSIERFIGIITEHYAGNFPLWLAPVEAKILPITDNEVEYANDIAKKLKENGFNVEVDSEYSKIGAKIRNAKLEKVPYMIILGKNEHENNVITVRNRKDEDIKNITLDEFINKMKEEIKNKE